MLRLLHPNATASSHTMNSTVPAPNSDNQIRQSDQTTKSDKLSEMNWPREKYGNAPRASNRTVSRRSL